MATTRIDNSSTPVVLVIDDGAATRRGGGYDIDLRSLTSPDVIVVRDSMANQEGRTDFAGERTDRLMPIKFGASPTKITNEGFRHYKGTATIGDVILPYANPARLEFRPADEVLSDEAIDSMVGKPITNDHPSALLNSTEHEEVKRRVEGAVISAVRAETKLGMPCMEVEVVVYTHPLQRLIEEGKAELSPGYGLTEDPKYDSGEAVRVVGEHEGRPYHVVQRDVKYNHLAVVDAARTRTPAGEVARLDEDDMTEKKNPGEAEQADATNKTGDKPSTDAKRLDMDLSSEAMEAIAALPEDDRKLLAAAMEAMKPSDDGESEGEEDSEEESDMSEMDEIKAKMDKMQAAIDKMSSRSDSKPAKTTAHFDAGDVIAKASEAAIKAADQHTASLYKDIETVRASSPERLDGYSQGEVYAAMLAEINEQTPGVKGLAERAIKEHRLDDVKDLYAEAVRVKGAKRLDAQENSIGGLVFAEGEPVHSLPEGA